MSGTVLSLGHLIYLIAWRRLIALVNRLIFRSVFGLHLGRIGVHLLRLSLWQRGDHLLLGLLSHGRLGDHLPGLHLVLLLLGLLHELLLRLLHVLLLGHLMITHRRTWNLLRLLHELLLGLLHVYLLGHLVISHRRTWHWVVLLFVRVDDVNLPLSSAPAA